MHVVVADGGETILNIIRRPLRERGDDVAVFADGRLALDHIRSTSTVDVLLTGLELKSLSGLELCWEVRNDPLFEVPIYIIVMSSSNDVAKLVEALDSGVDDFLRKPFVPEELCARMRAAQRARNTQKKLIDLAKNDPLTGVANRRSFFEQAESLIAATPAEGSAAAIMLDVDHFKMVNDTYGHDVGDAFLKKICKEIRHFCPVFGRLGGEEFAAFLPGKSISAAYKLAEAMRETVAGVAVAADGELLTVTCSLGVSEWCAGEKIDSLLKKADLALYKAKLAGRNLTVIFENSGNDPVDGVRSQRQA